MKARVPNPAYTLVGTRNVPRSPCSSIHVARWQKLLNYNGRDDVSSARANAALGAIFNFTRTYIRILYTVQPENLAGIKFGGLAPISVNKNIGGFKFGGRLT